MQSTAKLFLVALVLGVGVISALIFRRPAPTQTQVSPPTTNDTLVLRGQPAHIGPPSSPSTWKADIRTPQAAPSTSHMPVPIAVPSSPHLRRDPPPQLPSRYERSLPSVTRPILDPVQEIPTEELPKLTIVDPRGPAIERTHKIQDGDTLATLAEKYLGDSSRYQEIYAANSESLSNPDLLPIGLVLKIPASDSAVTAEAPQVRNPEPTIEPQGLPASDALPNTQQLPRRASDVGPLVPIPRGSLRRVTQ